MAGACCRPQDTIRCMDRQYQTAQSSAIAPCSAEFPQSHRQKPVSRGPWIPASAGMTNSAATPQTALDSLKDGLFSNSLRSLAFNAGHARELSSARRKPGPRLKTGPAAFSGGTASRLRGKLRIHRNTAQGGARLDLPGAIITHYMKRPSPAFACVLPQRNCSNRLSP
jgi:hypothetical protein